MFFRRGLIGGPQPHIRRGLAWRRRPKRGRPASALQLLPQWWSRTPAIAPQAMFCETSQNCVCREDRSDVHGEECQMSRKHAMIDQEYPVISCVASRHVVSCHLVSGRIVSCRLMSCSVISCLVAWRRAVLCHVSSYRVVFYLVASCRGMLVQRATVALLIKSVVQIQIIRPLTTHTITINARTTHNYISYFPRTHFIP